MCILAQPHWQYATLDIAIGVIVSTPCSLAKSLQPVGDSVTMWPRCVMLLLLCFSCRVVCCQHEQGRTLAELSSSGWIWLCALLCIFPCVVIPTSVTIWYSLLFEPLETPTVCNLLGILHCKVGWSAVCRLNTRHADACSSTTYGYYSRYRVHQPCPPGVGLMNPLQLLRA